jgi:hypothetical protein
MSAIPTRIPGATRLSKASAAEQVAAEPAPVLAKPEVKVSPVVEEDVLSGSVAANTRKRRASMVPGPATAPLPSTALQQRQSARRGSMAPKMLSSTIAATKSAVEAAVAAAAASAKGVPTKVPEPAASKVPRRKSLMDATKLLFSAPEEGTDAPLQGPTAVEGVEEKDTLSAVRPATMEAQQEDATPSVTHEQDISDVLPAKRRAGLRRGSLGASTTTAPVEGASSGNAPRVSNRRRSIADVTAMLASLDTLKAPAPAGGIAVASKKRGLVASSDENSARKNARVEISDTSAIVAEEHVWIDI